MMDINTILKTLPHRYPFLLVDRIAQIEPGERIVGIKNVSVNEPCFQGHFPEYPIFPGVLILEAMAQTGGICVLAMEPDEAPNKNLFFSSINKARFRKPVVPGDQIVIEMVRLKHKGTFWVFDGKARVDGEIAAQAELMASVVDKPTA
jgi:3-hydroxyacyl-[acyl-carrier-protein] dehydratase